VGFNVGEALPMRERNRLRAAVHAELGNHSLDVPADRFRTDEQIRCDVALCETSSQEPQNLTLAKTNERKGAGIAGALPLRLRPLNPSNLDAARRPLHAETAERVSTSTIPAVQKYVISELDSGQRVITERLSHVRSVALGYWIGAGSRDERDERAGVSHFIEHLLFKGSESYSAQEIAEIFDGLGGELNAATSREHTVVYARVADQHLETAIDVMSDMVYAPALAEVDAEREVVLEEIAMYEDQPQELVHDLIAEAVFGDHPLGRPVIGTTEVISTVSRRAISAYHRSMYVPGNVVVAAAGNLDHNELLGLLERAERKVQQPPARGRRVRSPLVKAPPPDLRFTRKDTEQYHVCVGAPGIARSDRRRFAASLLDAILGGSASSRLFQEIREKRGMAYAVYSFASQYTDTGQIGFYVGTREENLEECLAIAAEQVAEVAAGELKPNELERAKENLKGRILLSMESTSNRMSRLGKSLITDTEILSLDRIIAEIDAVEADALAELAGLLLAPDGLSAAGIGPSEERFLAAVERISPALTAAAA
jgi:predicted Zn-dependent peptidase